MTYQWRLAWILVYGLATQREQFSPSLLEGAILRFLVLSVLGGLVGAASRADCPRAVFWLAAVIGLASSGCMGGAGIYRE
jgi:hypothetical protein